MAIATIPQRAMSEQGFSFRNIIINGDMSIAQRGTSTSGLTSSGYYTCDRFYSNLNTVGTWTISQDTDVPSGQGFGYSKKYQCTTANASLSAGSNLLLEQRFEGQMLQHLKKGTSNAESLTLSFWVKSNKTGTYICEIDDNDNSRNINKSYTIDSADTWEKKTITFSGDTTGTLDNDNGYSLRIILWLSAGSALTTGTLATSWESTTNANRAVGQVNLADTVSNYINITGVQLEVGTSASDFEFLPYDVNLQRCKRYFQILGDNKSGTANEPIVNAYNYNGTYTTGVYLFNPVMRTAPTITSVSGTDYYGFVANSQSDNANSLSGTQTSNRSTQLFNNGDISGTAGHAGYWETKNNSAKVTADAEL